MSVAHRTIFSLYFAFGLYKTIFIGALSLESFQCESHPWYLRLQFNYNIGRSEKRGKQYD